MWWLLGLLVAVEALHEVLGIGGPDAVFSLGIQAALQLVAAALCIARCSFEPEGRKPWLWIGAGLWSWALGTVLWDLLYNANPSPPYPTAADALWLAWYPLTAIGMAMLIRERVSAFELPRWMDGVAAMLVVMTPAVALIVQPVADRSTDTWQATVVDFSYPILDVFLLGAVLGVFGLLAWRPGRTWLLLGLGIAMIAIADGLFSVQQARGVLVEGQYNFLWSGGAILIAAASWAGRPTEDFEGDIVGWRSIVLPVAAQLFAAGIQVYGLFFELGKSERLVTLIVLIVVTVQIIISRPRPVDAGRGRGP